MVGHSLGRMALGNIFNILRYINGRTHMCSKTTPDINGNLVRISWDKGLVHLRRVREERVLVPDRAMGTWC